MTDDRLTTPTVQPDAATMPPAPPAPPVGTAALASAGSTVRSNTASAASGGAGDGQGQPEPLFPAERADQFRSRWETVQTGFVDEPRKAVEDADALVAEVMQQLATSFADERSGLESRWSTGSDVSTEDLRQALRRYRSFFDRLLSL